MRVDGQTLSVPDVTPTLLGKYDVPGPRYTSYPAVPDWRGAFDHEAWAGHLGVLGTTQAAIDECLTEVASWPADERPTIELETYAWDALPDGARGGSALVDGIAREIRWLEGRMDAAGLGSREAAR